MLLFTSMSYVVSQQQVMESYENDIYKSEVITNAMKEYAELKILDYNFMPTIEILPNGDIHQDDLFTLADLQSSNEVYKTEDGMYKVFPMDVEKLQNFVEPVIKFHRRIESVSSYIVEPMRRCTPEDFERRGHVFIHEQERVAHSYRLCPNWERLDFLSAKNGYSNTEERLSFSLEINLCNKNHNPNCASKEKQEAFFSVMMFNVFVLTEN